MFVAIPKYLRNKAKDVSPNHNRMQAILLETDENVVMIVNVYFPPDPKTKAYSMNSDLEDVLATIENLIDSQNCNDVIIVGDLNCDIKRDNGRVDRMRTFLSTNSMEMAWETFDVDYTHEFELDNITYTSTIDHVLWNSNLRSRVENGGVMHPFNNTSDHSPIYCDLTKTFSTTQKAKNVKNEQNGVSTKNLDDYYLFILFLT